ncbi:MULTISPECIES: trehalose-phosphatase [unclassified Nocardioides]|uniref:trehalose-phosphatase n=1 Tax=unclassified Nocardioides TaxID=2615069 RepID=UPI000700AE9C|nr:MULTISPECIES: trehalose-phosphatase [unclassified Nocardioides]KQY55418.1 haloacid dehalogenase [Nocardioides sp. Root140]KQZ75474.1 haloacid dehalogenase [Nocardioides sp. Root151]
MEFISATGEERYAALVRVAADSVIGLDLDGTLSPIVDDPSLARIHPDAGEVLVELAEHVAAIAIITGRPARQALALGGLDDVGNAIGEMGKELYIFGQYGNERWSSVNRRVISPRPPHGLASFLLGLPSLLRRADAFDAYVEEKGLAVAVHTRRLPDATAAFERLLGPVSELAAANDLTVEPGRSVIEVRAPGTHKGDAVHTIAEELSTRGFMFAGDDLGDLEAFAAVEELRQAGQATLLVCSSSDEQGALLRRADVSVDGPEGVLDLLRQLSRDAASARL